MPKSNSPRQRAAYTPPPASKAKVPNPPWFVPLMVGLMIAGLAWIVATYLSQSAYPIPKIGQWNLAVGFVMLLGGFGMTTRWR